MSLKMSVDQTLLKASSFVKKNKIQEAKKLYQSILMIFPKNIRAQQGLYELENPKQSVKEAVRSLLNLYNKNDYLTTVEQAQAFSKIYTNAISIWNILGASTHKIGMFEKSIEAYNKCISLKPDYAEAYNNLGNVLADQGRIDEAVSVYKKAILLKPQFVEAFLNLGNALKYQGNLNLAIESYEKALTLKPDYTIAHNNLGNILKDQGKLDKATEAYKKSILINPNYAEPYSNLGNALMDKGELDEAICVYEKCIQLKPNYPIVYNNIGAAYKKKGEFNKAIEAFVKSISLHPNYDDAFRNLAETLVGVTFKEFNPTLQTTIISLLEKKTYVRPKNIAKAVLSLLKLEPTLKKYLQPNYLENIATPIEMIIEDLSELTLLIKFMSICPVSDIDIENLLRDIRSKILTSNLSLERSPKLFKFQSALALQCYNNEYIFHKSKEEEKALENLEKIVKLSLTNNKQNSNSILCLASYKPLNQYEWCNQLNINNELEDLFIRQFQEPLQENILRSDFITLKEIKNDVSSRVREQYETNPYPRWTNLSLTLKPFEISKWINEIKIKLFNETIKTIEFPEILVAGCGTGQHSIETAARFKNCNVTAVDLSLSSLTYAKRKTMELGIKNIKYIQADILDLSHLNQQFDIIECIGVLHHMYDPIAGWKVLTDCLKPGGLMRIGLYSELARKHIVKTRKEIFKEDLKPNETDMKNLRLRIMKSKEKHHKEILNSTDFYSLSELRDLLFHVQEHRYSIPKIQDSLSGLNLQFCGFDDEYIKSNFKQIHHDIDDLYNLGKWHAYEEKNQSVFSGMYQFWCQKISQT